MADETSVRFLILWENELRAAAQAFADAHRLQDDDNASDDDRAAALAIAMRLADLALHGAEDEEATLLLSAPRDIFKRNTQPNYKYPADLQDSNGEVGVKSDT